MTHEIKIIFIIFLTLFLGTVFNCTIASAYSIENNNTNQNVVQSKQTDLNITTQSISNSINNVVNNVLKSFSSGQNIDIQNVPKTIQLSNFSKNKNISSQGVISIVIDLMKLSINLLFATISIVVVILKVLLNSLNSYRG